MGFKSDREFLRNVSIGAIGTRQVASILAKGGFEVIELERYSSSNKIWATKIKRLRVPDLLCLKSGIRIESRAKSSLEVTMSHAEKNPERAWDKGLRDSDLIAFIRCSAVDDTWQPSNRIALFRVGEMRATAGLAGLSRMKAASEGSEIRLTWPATVPNAAGKVTAVSSDRIETHLSSGRRQAYRLMRTNKGSLVPYVKPGDVFGDGDTIIASAMTSLVSPTLVGGAQYDFLGDLESDQVASVYIAVKALGFLPKNKSKSATSLTQIMETHEDKRVSLEASASLARLGIDDGWNHLAKIVGDSGASPEYRMESALILAEQPCPRSIELLEQLADGRTNSSELRAAGAWGLAAVKADIEKVLTRTADADELVAVHAIAGASRLIGANNIGKVLNMIGNDSRLAAGIVKAVVSSKFDFVPEAVRQIQLATLGARRQWLLYSLAAAGKMICEPFIATSAPALLGELAFFWDYHADNWTNRLDVADQVDFLEKQLF